MTDDSIHHKTLEAINFTPHGHLQIINQLALPHKTEYVDIRGVEDGHAAIASMMVRGAPAIAVVAALSLSVELNNKELLMNGSAKAAAEFILDKLEFLKTSRPTAVNLFIAARELGDLVQNISTSSSSAHHVITAYQTAAHDMLAKDLADNKAIGQHGAEFILSTSSSSSTHGVSILTHCNTGSLATSGWGTALGVCRSLFTHPTTPLKHVYCTETRPYNQGSRLTAYELVYEGIPSTLICDSMVSALLKQKQITAIVVGADRVTSNGDTANKIGTYQLAISAKYHGVPFFVAAPCTSIDLGLKTGDEIPIEERPAVEMTTIRGRNVNSGNKCDADYTTVSIAANGIGVWNPGFDVTPASLITGIITERGVVQKKAGSEVFDLIEFVKKSCVQ